MGCDIHAHTEVKINGKWHHLSALSIARWYALFSKMAGVRTYEGCPDPIAEPRDLPEDATELTMFDSNRWGVDGHSHSYLTAAELAEICDWYDEEVKKADPSSLWPHTKDFGWVFGNTWDCFVKFPDDLTEGLEDARIVFWFDN